jgi:hypothetical protein
VPVVAVATVPTAVSVDIVVEKVPVMSVIVSPFSVDELWTTCSFDCARPFAKPTFTFPDVPASVVSPDELKDVDADRVVNAPVPAVVEPMLGADANTLVIVALFKASELEESAIRIWSAPTGTDFAACSVIAPLRIVPPSTRLFRSL